MQQVGFGVLFLYPLFVYSCPTSLVNNMIFSASLAPGKIYWGHGAGAKGHGVDTVFFFFIALKHGADTFLQSHAMERILFSTTLKPIRRYLQIKMQLQLYFSTK